MSVVNSLKYTMNALCIFAFPFVCYSDISQENLQKYLDFIEFPQNQSLSPRKIVYITLSLGMFTILFIKIKRYLTIKCQI